MEHCKKKTAMQEELIRSYQEQQQAYREQLQAYRESREISSQLIAQHEGLTQYYEKIMERLKQDFPEVWSQVKDQPS